MNRKGFTLIELLATLIILAIVMSIAGFSIVAILNGIKQKNYDLLVDNIKSGATNYYQECKYSPEVVASMLGVTKNDNKFKNFCNFEITLGELVQYGYIKGNEESGNLMGIVNPKDNVDIKSCKIKVTADSNGKLSFTSLSSGASCPTY